MEHSRQRIMVIDDNITNLNIARMALEKEYEVVLIPSGEKALSLFDRIIPDLILLDVEMPGMNGFEVIRKLKQLPFPICDIPVVFVTAKNDSSSEFEGLNLGAVDYITKPLSFPLLLKRVELHLTLACQKNELLDYNQNLKRIVEEKTKEISEIQYSIIHVLSDMVERIDGSTGHHLVRTQKYLEALLEEAIDEKIYADELGNDNLELFVKGSLLHDIGKVSIPSSILLKPGKLTEEEFNIMKTHTTLGENAIRLSMVGVQETEFLDIASNFAGAHHEKWNGTGYPRGLSGTDIPIAGRLMAIADVYDALISKRPYKEAFSHEKATEIIMQGCGSHFDPILTGVFEAVKSKFEQIAEENTDDPSESDVK